MFIDRMKLNLSAYKYSCGSMGLPIYEEMDEITLGGVIKELGSESYFQVSVDKNKSVYTLKEEISKKIEIYCQGRFDTISLKVWSVEVPKKDDSSKLDEIKDDSASVESVLAGVEAPSIHRIEEYFKNSDENYVHFVVQGVRNFCSLCSKRFENDDAYYEHVETDQYLSVFSRYYIWQTSKKA